MSKLSLTSSSPFINEVITSFQTAGLNETTQQLYIRWIREFIAFNGKTKHPKDITDKEIALFINSIGTQKKLGFSSQNQALSALLHVYRYVVGRPIGDLENLMWAKKPKKLPVVYSQEEITMFLSCLNYPLSLIVKLSLCSGLRLSECASLKIGNLDFNRGVINVIEGKNKKDRETRLPAVLAKDLEVAIDQAKKEFSQDNQYASSGAKLIWHNEKHYPVTAVKCEREQYLFTANKYRLDLREACLRREPLNRQYISSEFKRSLKKAGIEGKGSFHSLRHTFASYAYHHGSNIRELQLLLGHSSIKTTMIYTHLLPDDTQVTSPIDVASPSDEET